MSDIYLAIFSTTIVKILCFFGLHKMEMNDYLFSLWCPLELGTF